MTGQAATTIALSQDAIAQLMPMSVLVGPTGHIGAAGPTLAKLLPEIDLNGARFLEIFELKHPRNVTTISGLSAATGASLSLRLRNAPATTFRGLAVALQDNGGLLINLSFGIGVVEAVGTYGLTNGDFAVTDLTVEMLYLVEANAAVHAVSQDLMQRLDSAKMAAEEQAFTDTLTGLKNRRAMDAVLGQYANQQTRFALMHIDLDHFKAVNDTLGHAAGDHVLQEVARILIDETRSEDTVVRLGGDEFLVIFHKLTRPDQLSQIAGRLLDRLKTPIAFGTETCLISGSIGITVSEDYDEIDAERMLHDADMALYASKNGGRGQLRFVKDSTRGAMPDAAH